MPRREILNDFALKSKIKGKLINKNHTEYKK